MLDVLLVLGTAFPPADEYVVPGDFTLLELPALLFGVELGREGGIYEVRVLFLVVVGRHVEPKGFAQGHRVAHPGLPELVVGRALVTVLDLLVVPLLSGRPNHSSVSGNIQSTARWSSSFFSGSLENAFIHFSPCLRWKFSSRSTLTRALFHGPYEQLWWMSLSSTKPALS